GKGRGRGGAVGPVAADGSSMTHVGGMTGLRGAICSHGDDAGAAAAATSTCPIGMEIVCVWRGAAGASDVAAAGGCTKFGAGGGGSHPPAANGTACGAPGSIADSGAVSS